MNLSRYLEICKEIEDAEHATEDKKRQSYTAGNGDVLHNFNDDAEFVGTNPLQNVLTHLMKQIRAISSYVKNPDIEPSETLLSRVVDVRVYSKLLVAVATEMGRDTGIGADWESFKNEVMNINDAESWQNELSNPIFTHTVGGDCCKHFSIVAIAKEDEAKAKVLNDYYSYTFGKDDV